MKCSSTSTEHVDPATGRIVKHRHGPARWRRFADLNPFVYCDRCADNFTSIGHIMVLLEGRGWPL
jgi:hypothetical protein